MPRHCTGHQRIHCGPSGLPRHRSHLTAFQFLRSLSLFMEIREGVNRHARMHFPQPTQFSSSTYPTPVSGSTHMALSFFGHAS